MSIKAGAKIRTGDRPPAAGSAYSATSIGNITTTTFTVDSQVTFTFTAPASGTILVLVGGGSRDNTGSGNKAELDYEIYEGTSASGTAKKTATTTTSSAVGVIGLGGTVAGEGSGLDYAYFSRGSLLTGLTPGATHFARLMYRATASGGVDISARELTVIPV